MWRHLQAKQRALLAWKAQVHALKAGHGFSEAISCGSEHQEVVAVANEHSSLQKQMVDSCQKISSESSKQNAWMVDK